MIKIDSREFSCPVELTLTLFNDKSKTFIVFILQSGRKRFKEICEAFPAVTQKTITQKLKELESDRLVDRTVYAEVPLRVEYELSAVGKEYKKVLDAMFDFGETYAKEYGKIV